MAQYIDEESESVDSYPFFGDPIKDEFWNGLSEEDRLLIIEEDEARINAARTDINAFFEYVMREQTTRMPIKVLPHQRVGLAFIMHHDRSVNMWPRGFTKTFCMAAVTLFLLGQDPTRRGAIVSETRAQAAKILSVVSDYILESPELHRVFPKLRKSTRQGDAWTQHEITIQRPPGIPDASLIAVGRDGAKPGGRLNWLVVDDILDMNNTATKAGRDAVYTWFDGTMLGSLDPVGAKVVVTNTTWHPDDLVHRLENMGWPTLRMDIVGNIKIQDDSTLLDDGYPEWNHPELRPATKSGNEENYRLKSHDPDPTNSIPLWPEKFSAKYIEHLRKRHLPFEFNRAYMNLCKDDKTSMCSQEYIDKCKKIAREIGVFELVSGYHGPNPTFTGVDLAVGPGENHDDTAFFTFEARPDGLCVVLDIEVGQWNGPEIVEKLFIKHARYKSIVVVENNGSQEFIRQFALQKKKNIPIKAYTTGRTKAHPEYGVAGLFLELANGAWAVPNNKRMECHPFVQQWIDACLYYTPSKHTPDVLMACFFAREQAKQWGLLVPAEEGAGGDIGAIIMAR